MLQHGSLQAVTGHSNAQPPGYIGKVVLLTAEAPLAEIVTNYVVGKYPDLVVIREPAETKSQIIRRRLRLLGPVKTLGQIAGGLATRVVAKFSKARISEICVNHGLNTELNSSIAIHRVASVNAEETYSLLTKLLPTVVVVYGTRIISRRILQSTSAPFINYHAGINPKYRGQHPAYWALASRDPDHVGITIHLVDDGIDTGAVLYQAPVRFSHQDNITTCQYPSSRSLRHGDVSSKRGLGSPDGLI